MCDDYHIPQMLTIYEISEYHIYRAVENGMFSLAEFGTVIL
jgi:hypothetical protein